MRSGGTLSYRDVEELLAEHGISVDHVTRWRSRAGAKRDAAAAERFLTKALAGENHPAPRVINTDKHAGYPPAIVELKIDGVLEEKCRHRPVQYQE